MSQNIGILGAGIVGVCCALELQRRGFQTTIYDRNEPISETSFGNAGVLSVGSIHPQAGPGVWRHLPRFFLNRDSRVHVNHRHLFSMAGFLRNYLACCTESMHRQNAHWLHQLLSRSVEAHRTLIMESGSDQLLSEKGWLTLYRNTATPPALASELLREFDVAFETLDTAGIQHMEPHLGRVYKSGLWIKNTAAISNPGLLGKNYTHLYAGRGGVIIRSEIERLEAVTQGWKVHGHHGLAQHDQLIMAMGAWNQPMLASLGCQLPLIAERGYHQHFQPQPGTVLSRPILDNDFGFVLAPMDMGYRLTSGVEWAPLDSAPTPVQLAQVATKVREAFPLADKTGPIWMGNRPETPDCLPIIGSVPGYSNLYLATGHGHLGLTLSAITGVALARQMNNEPSDIDLAPYSAARFM